MTNEIKIFVYGSCHFSELLDRDELIGIGGYGVVIKSKGQRIELSGGYSNTTNARMDIIGIIEGLKKIIEPSNIIVYLTNGYVIDTLTKGWLKKWKVEGFKKKKHVDLWIQLDKILSDTSHSISFQQSKSVKYTPDFKLAEHLGKSMSGKRNLPNDLQGTEHIVYDYFGIGSEEKSNKILEVVNDTPILTSISVDASSIQNPGPTEYRGVDTKTKQLLFEKKLNEATNNIGEFLAIVHALALYKKQGKELEVIYSDSSIAISWVKQKKCKTKFEKSERNSETFEIIERAITWLHNNEYKTKIFKWNTGAWGQIPADYGRK